MVHAWGGGLTGVAGLAGLTGLQLVAVKLIVGDRWSHAAVGKVVNNVGSQIGKGGEGDGGTPPRRRQHRHLQQLIGIGALLLAGALPAMVNALAPEGLRRRYNATLTLAMISGMWGGPLLAAGATALGRVWLLFVTAVALLAVVALLVRRPRPGETLPTRQETQQRVPAIDRRPDSASSLDDSPAPTLAWAHSEPT